MDPFRNQRGFGFVSILLALLIVAALYFGYFKMQNTMGGRSVGISAINASREIACRTQRQQVERDIMMWSVNHPDEPPTIAALERDGLRIPSCPEGGHYSIVGRDVQCSVHR
jgi:competence protein ComGC